MCFDKDSVPPAPLHIAGQPVVPVTALRLALPSHDGSAFSAFLARPARPSGVGVVVLPDMRGIFHFYEQLAVRLAEQGHTALAIDYFGRTAGIVSRDETFPFMEHIMRVTRETIDLDISAAGEYLRKMGDDACHTIVALGFCFGGRQAFLASAQRFGFAGVIGFYGALSFYPNGAPGPLQHASQLSAPILGLFGGADGGIPASEISAFDQALRAAAVAHEFVTYPGAPHSFFDVKYSAHAEACQDAWRRVLEFIEAAGARPSTSSHI